MAEVTAQILMTEFVTHDVKRFIVERPKGYAFEPGQATEVSVNLPGWQDKKSPFTFTSLDEDKVLEFTIKGYFDRDGVTKKLHSLVPGDELILRDVWGTIVYKEPGVFLAGGAGITPFIAILRRLRNDGRLAGNRLIVSNKTVRDVVLRQEFEEMLGDDFVLTLTRAEAPGCLYGRVDQALLGRCVRDFSRAFYVCGPRPFVKDVKAALKALGASAESIVVEL